MGQQSTIDVFAVLWQRRRLILGTAIVVAVVVAVYSLIMPHTYMAIGTVMPPRQTDQSPLAQLLTGGTVPLKLSDIETPASARLALDILKSQRAARIILSQTGLEDHPEFRDLPPLAQWGKLLGMFDYFINSNGLLTIQAYFKTPYFPTDEEEAFARQMAAKLVNAAITALDSIRRQQYIASARQMREYLTRALRRARHRLDSLHTAMANFRKQHNILQLEQQVSAIVQAAIDLAVQIAETQTKLDLARLELGPDQPLVHQLAAKLAALQNRYRALQEGGLVPEDALAIPLSQIPDLSKEYARLLQELKVQEQVTLFLEQQRAQEELKEEKNIPTIQVLDYAQPPLQRYAPRRATMVLIAFFATVIVLSVLVVMRELRRRMKEDSTQAAQ